MTQDYADKYGVFPVDFDSITETLKNTTGNGVISGFDATVTGSNLIVTVASGVARVAGNRVAFGSSTAIDFTGNVDASKPKKAFIVIDASSAMIKRLGIAADPEPVSETRRLTVTPDPPELQGSDIVLFEVWLTAGTTTIVSSDVSDRRITVSDYTELPTTASVGATASGGDTQTIQKPASIKHVHGIPVGTPAGLGNTASAGASGNFSDALHIHKRDVRVQSAAADIGTRNALNFVSGVSVVDNPANDRVDVTVSGGGHTIEDEGVALTQRTPLNFVGTGVTVTDTGTKTQVSIPSGGAAGHYGIRAFDFVTTGDGTRTNPYNISAIETAINALPAQGGIVFVKTGFYDGARINLGRTGEAGRAKTIIIRGESTDLSGLNAANYDAVGGNGLYGVWIRGGFRVNTYGCQVAFQNLMLQQPTAGGATLLFEGKLDDEAITGNNVLPLGGFRIQDCKFIGGDPAIHVTGVNTGATGHQNWNVLIERIHVREALRVLRIDDDGGSAYNSIFRGNIQHVVFQACGPGASTAEVIHVDIANLKGIWHDWLVEDCGGTAAGAYVMRINCARSEGFLLDNIDFGDNARSPKNAHISCNLSGQIVLRNYIFRKNIELYGFVDAELGRAAQFGDTGTINTFSEGAIGGVDGLPGIIVRGMRGLHFPIGTITTPTNVKIVSTPGGVASHATGQGDFPATRISMRAGTSGNRGVLKMWDGALGAFRYLWIDLGSLVISATEPT